MSSLGPGPSPISISKVKTQKKDQSLRYNPNAPTTTTTTHHHPPLTFKAYKTEPSWQNEVDQVMLK